MRICLVIKVVMKEKSGVRREVRRTRDSSINEEKGKGVGGRKWKTVLGYL